MKILQLCKKIPHPLKDGESIAIHYLSKGLVRQGCTVHLLAINTLKHFVQYDKVPAELSHYGKIGEITLDTKVKPLAAFLNLFTSESYNIKRFISNDYEQLLKQYLIEECYDVVQLETLYMAPYISTIIAHSDAKIVMRSHNLESEIWSNLSNQSSNIFIKPYYKLCAERLHAFESEAQRGYDSLLPISPMDYEKYLSNNYKGHEHITPIGLDMDRYTFNEHGAKHLKRLGYIGSLDWKPNIEGLDWFFTEVWGGLQNENRQLEFHLAGRNAEEKYQDSSLPNFKMHSEVDDALAFINELDIMVVPLFSGSGIRVKILECMALGKVVISTAKGFEGIPIEDGKHCFVFESKSELISAVRQCIAEPELVEKIRREARVLVEQHFEYQVIAQNVLKHYQQLILEE